ncbi:hypothetical protein M409DRAFT_19624 [Zasmidium cellare ATCC 36951]|uniref:Uncharacterized protein n=1 Tax=Zasmidium cellare ATCC 36951 TaxID=1080233 RepID=A0A6A6CSE2_ZASCE|nr:uncharacterized protein M409DRAFT_19624 [Zasmidium cellare ATCC 36951]KAF2170011.1 hypothetical protein M409DRAFT_19624 [Zasmidium cellare ATCC 36951]
MVGLSASIWAVPAPKQPSPVAPAALPAPPPAPKEEGLSLLGHPDLTSETHAIAGDAEKEMASAKKWSGFAGVPSPAFNEEGLPLLYRPGLTSDARATADTMTKAKSSAARKARPRRKVSSPAVNTMSSPAIPRPTVPPGDLTKVQSLVQQEIKLLVQKETIKAKLEEVSQQINRVRQMRSAEVDKMTGNVRREALKMCELVKAHED